MPIEYIITGGFTTDDSILKTTEIVSIDPPISTEGPELPDYFYGHCSVLVNNEVFLIGGIETKTKVLAISVKDGSMSYKSPLQIQRFHHSCSTITGNDGYEKIVVTGGCCGLAYSSTEIYSVEDDIWTHGKIVINHLEFLVQTMIPLLRTRFA